MKFLVFAAFIFVSIGNLASEPIESITPNEAYVGDQLIYKISMKEVSSISIPEGEFSLGNELPSYKIYDKKEEDQFSTAKLSFTNQATTHSL